MLRERVRPLLLFTLAYLCALRVICSKKMDEKLDRMFEKV